MSELFIGSLFYSVNTMWEIFKIRFQFFRHNVTGKGWGQRGGFLPVLSNARLKPGVSIQAFTRGPGLAPAGVSSATQEKLNEEKPLLSSVTDTIF